MRPAFHSIFASPCKRKPNSRAAVPALIEGFIPLPPLLCLRSKGALEGIYTGEHMPAREISRMAGASRSGVLKALPGSVSLGTGMRG